jgi:hypothetical protein
MGLLAQALVEEQAQAQAEAEAEAQAQAQAHPPHGAGVEQPEDLAVPIVNWVAEDYGVLIGGDDGDSDDDENPCFPYNLFVGALVTILIAIACALGGTARLHARDPEPAVFPPT